MSSLSTRVGHIVWLISLGVILNFSSLVYGDDRSMLQDARDKLEQALNQDPPNDADRTTLLQSTLEILKHLPPLDDKTDKRHLKQAIAYVDSALFELKNGDPSQRVPEDIRNADSDIRSITATGK